MPVTDTHHDLQALTLTFTAQFAAPPARVWQVYADPEQLSQVWGPPGYPATVVDHDLSPGGRVTYVMTGPEGERYPGYWEVLETDEPRSFRFRDGFADETFAPDPTLPTSEVSMTFTATDGGTEVVAVTTFATTEGLQTVLDMGVVEGTREAMNQIDGLFAPG